MEKICGIIDMDGFFGDRRFLVRELGLIGMTDFIGRSYRFDLRNHANEISNFKTVRFVERNITGLKFFPSVKEKRLYYLHQLDEIVTSFYRNVRNTNADVLAFKGGFIEKDLLQKLKIPFVNLEDYGCPKFDCLKDPWIYSDCGYHLKPRMHCAVSEIEAFKIWLERQIYISRNEI